jgi:hypothetical protein
VDTSAGTLYFRSEECRRSFEAGESGAASLRTGSYESRGAPTNRARSSWGVGTPDRVQDDPAMATRVARGLPGRGIAR